MVSIDGFDGWFCRFVNLISSDLARVEELLDGKKSLLLGCPCVVVTELVVVYKGFGYRLDEGRVVACGGVWIYRGEGGVRISDLGYLSQEGVMVVVLCT